MENNIITANVGEIWTNEQGKEFLIFQARDFYYNVLSVSNVPKQYEIEEGRFTNPGMLSYILRSNFANLKLTDSISSEKMEKLANAISKELGFDKRVQFVEEAAMNALKESHKQEMEKAEATIKESEETIQRLHRECERLSAESGVYKSMYENLLTKCLYERSGSRYDSRTAC